MEWMLDRPGHKEHPRYYLIGSYCLPVWHGGEPLNLTVVRERDRAAEHTCASDLSFKALCRSTPTFSDLDIPENLEVFIQRLKLC